jgi:uncharacterized membrane protein YfcA
MFNVEILGLLALIGATGGLIAGLVGLAGGIFIVPALVALFGPQCMPDAIVISFFAVLLNSLSTSHANWRMKGTENYWALINSTKWYTLGALVASCFVAFLFGQHKNAIPVQLLAFLQLLLAICMLIPRAWYESSRFDHAKWKDSTAGSIVGGISTLIGVGGGTYTIFYFLIHGREIKDCTLTANFVGIFIGLMSLIGYYGYVAVASTSHVATSSGIIDATGKTVLIVCGVLTAPMGVKLQSRAPASLIKKLIVYMLAASSSYVFFYA